MRENGHLREIQNQLVAKTPEKNQSVLKNLETVTEKLWEIREN